MIINTTKKLLFIGADPAFKDSTTSGGQGTASRALIEHAVANGVEVFIVDTSQSHMEVVSKIYKIRRAVRRFRLLFSLLKQHKFDSAIIFSSSGMSYVEKSLMAFVCQKSGTPVTMCMRSGHFQNQCEHKKMWRRVYAVLSGIPTRHVVQGEAWKKLFKTLGVPDANIDIARNWPRNYVKLRETPKKEPKELSFLFVGWVVLEKGMFELLEAVGNSEKLRRTKINIVGNGSFMEGAVNICREKELHNVLFHGNIPHKDVLSFYENSDVLVLPSYAEGFPNVIVEALYYGLPVISTDVGAITDSVMHYENGIIVEKGDAVSLQKAMELFVDSPEVIPNFSIRSLEIANSLHKREENCNVFLSGLGF
ncbi:MAG: glycosyltransferase family 4 protein [Aliivibrio sp.]|uniref:glycosyltransferase family 4 protein n=1 Tax=Aliivibrio sp. TaxID=1872443 RepID=UPI001A43E1D5|nr:glycosyltransferase family 4 protein [Aliivibrio sp.]